MKITISVVQFKPKIHLVDESFKRAEQFIKEAKIKDSKIICFPESFLVGPYDYYTNKEETDYLTKKFPNLFKKKFKKLSKTYDLAIIAGTIEEELARGRVVNRCYVFDRGKIVHHYDKINLFTSEKTVITPGSANPKVINLRGVKIAVTICRDLFYPNIYSKLAKLGTQIIFVPSMWSARSNLYNSHNKLAAKYKIKMLSNKITKIMGESRAIENGVFLVFANCCGAIKVDNKFEVFMGKSFIASPLEGIFCKTSYLLKENLLTVTLNLDAVEDSKKIYEL